MAFTIITSTQRYTCLSTDTKTTDGVKLGSLAFETDTGNEFIFNGTTWVPYSQSTKLNGSLANIPIIVADRTGKKVIQNDVSAISIPAGSYATVNVTDCDKFTSIEAGIGGADTFQSKVVMLPKSAGGNIAPSSTDILASASRRYGSASVACIGTANIIYFYNEDGAAAHSIYKYVAGKY